MNSRDELTSAVEQDRALYAAAYRAGFNDGAAAAMDTGCPHVHPAISASVREMFDGWDGAAAAQRRSVGRFRAERRQGVTA